MKKDLLKRVGQFTLVWVHCVAATFAQNYYPKKDAAFGQVAVGKEIKTVINLTNRGTYPYQGTIIFLKGENEIWNPLVNESPVSNGEYMVEIQPNSTTTIRVSGNQLQSGAALLISQDLLLDNFVEANLTYFVGTDGEITDSVGVSPSQEFYLASVPFENFDAIALALVNGDLSAERLARVSLRLFDQDGSQLDTKTLEMGSLFHFAKFLSELFPEISLQFGKVEISSDFPIFGTALTLEKGQLSSLPLQPSPVSYSSRLITSGGSVATGGMTLWAEGFFVTGYFLISAVDQEPVEESVLILVNGQPIDGFLQLSFPIQRDPFFSEQATLYLEHDNFSFDSPIVASTWVQMFLSDHSTLTGTYELNRLNQ